MTAVHCIPSQCGGASSSPQPPPPLQPLVGALSNKAPPIPESTTPPHLHLLKRRAVSRDAARRGGLRGIHTPQPHADGVAKAVGNHGALGGCRGWVGRRREPGWAAFRVSRQRRGGAGWAHEPTIRRASAPLAQTRRPSTASIQPGIWVHQIPGACVQRRHRTATHGRRPCGSCPRATPAPGWSAGPSRGGQCVSFACQTTRGSPTPSTGRPSAERCALPTEGDARLPPPELGRAAARRRERELPATTHHPGAPWPPARSCRPRTAAPGPPAAAHQWLPWPAGGFGPLPSRSGQAARQARGER